MAPRRNGEPSAFNCPFQKSTALCASVMRASSLGAAIKTLGIFSSGFSPTGKYTIVGDAVAVGLAVGVRVAVPVAVGGRAVAVATRGRLVAAAACSIVGVGCDPQAVTPSTQTSPSSTPSMALLPLRAVSNLNLLEGGWAL